MKNKQPSTAPLWPPAWQTANGLSIVDFVLSGARGRGLACTEIEAAAGTDPRSRNRVTIACHRCKVLPGRVLDRDEGYGEGMLRLHPAFEWLAEFLIYIVKGSQFDLFILPANDANRRGASSIDTRSLEPYKDGWQLLGTVAAPQAVRRKGIPSTTALRR